MNSYCVNPRVSIDSYRKDVPLTIAVNAVEQSCTHRRIKGKLIISRFFFFVCAAGRCIRNRYRCIDIITQYCDHLLMMLRLLLERLLRSEMFNFVKRRRIIRTVKETYFIVIDSCQSPVRTEQIVR